MYLLLFFVALPAHAADADFRETGTACASPWSMPTAVPAEARADVRAEQRCQAAALAARRVSDFAITSAFRGPALCFDATADYRCEASE